MLKRLQLSKIWKFYFGGLTSFLKFNTDFTNKNFTFFKKILKKNKIKTLNLKINIFPSWCNKIKLKTYPYMAITKIQ